MTPDEYRQIAEHLAQLIQSATKMIYGLLGAGGVTGASTYLFFEDHAKVIGAGAAMCSVGLAGVLGGFNAWVNYRRLQIEHEQKLGHGKWNERTGGDNDGDDGSCTD